MKLYKYINFYSHKLLFEHARWPTHPVRLQTARILAPLLPVQLHAHQRWPTYNPPSLFDRPARNIIPNLVLGYFWHLRIFLRVLNVGVANGSFFSYPQSRGARVRAGFDLDLRVARYRKYPREKERGNRVL